LSSPSFDAVICACAPDEMIAQLATVARNSAVLKRFMIVLLFASFAVQVPVVIRSQTARPQSEVPGVVSF
jgi:hypothetical protein